MKGSWRAPLGVTAIALIAVGLYGCGTRLRPDASTSATQKTSSGTGSPTLPSGPTRMPLSRSVVCFSDLHALVAPTEKQLAHIQPEDLLQRPLGLIRIMRLPNGKLVGTCIPGESRESAGL